MGLIARDFGELGRVGGRGEGRGKAGTYGFLSGWYFLLSVLYAFLMSLSEADLSIPSSL